MSVRNVEKKSKVIKVMIQGAGRRAGCVKLTGKFQGEMYLRGRKTLTLKQ